MRRIAALAVLIALGPTCALGGNVVNIHDTDWFPVQIGPIESALWVEGYGYYDTEGRGAALLFLSDEEADCDDALSWSAYMSYYYGGEDAPRTITDDGHGLLAYWVWYDEEGGDAGYEGTYGSFGGGVMEDEGHVVRQMQVLAWDEGVIYYAGGYGASGGYGTIVDHGGGEVSGSLDMAELDATFRAENCGEAEDTYDSTYDSGTAVR